MHPGLVFDVKDGVAYIFRNGKIYTFQSIALTPGEWVYARFNKTENICDDVEVSTIGLKTIKAEGDNFYFIGGYVIGTTNVKPFGKLDVSKVPQDYKAGEVVTAIFKLAVTPCIVTVHEILYRHEDGTFGSSSAFPLDSIRVKRTRKLKNEHQQNPQQNDIFYSLGNKKFYESKSDDINDVNFDPVKYLRKKDKQIQYYTPNLNPPFQLPSSISSDDLDELYYYNKYLLQDYSISPRASLPLNSGDESRGPKEYMNDPRAWSHALRGEKFRQLMEYSNRHLLFAKFESFAVLYDSDAGIKNFGVIFRDEIDAELYESLEVGGVYEGTRGQLLDSHSAHGMPSLYYYLIQPKKIGQMKVQNSIIYDDNLETAKVMKRSWKWNDFSTLEVESFGTIAFPTKYVHLCPSGVLTKGTVRFYVHPNIPYFWGYVGEFTFFNDETPKTVHIDETETFYNFVKTEYADYLKFAGPQFYIPFFKDSLADGEEEKQKRKDAFNQPEMDPSKGYRPTVYPQNSDDELSPDDD